AVRRAASAGERPAPPVLARPAFDAAAPLAVGLRRIEEPVPGSAVPRRAADERPGGTAAGATGGRPERQVRLGAVVQRAVGGPPRGVRRGTARAAGPCPTCVRRRCAARRGAPPHRRAGARVRRPTARRG